MKSGMLKGFIVLLLLCAGLYGFWLWFFCRFYVGPGQIAVIRANIGKPLPPGQLLAEEGQQGIQARVLGEGRYFLNPYLYDWEVKPATLIPPGKVGLVTAKVGTDLQPGEFIAGPGQKGIQRGVLGPGKYRLNPYGYNVDTIDATSIPIGYVGVLSSQSGQQTPPGQFAGANQKGTRRDVLQPGLYYVNPKELKVDVLEIGVNQVSLLGQGGGEVITKSQVSSANTALQLLNRNIIAEQNKQREDYIMQNAANWKSAPQAPAAQRRSGVASRGSSHDGRQAGEQVAQQGVPQQASTPDQAVLSFNQQVNFPSRDGFDISLDMTVEFEFTPESIAWVFQNYGDLPKVVDTIIMPQILSISRLRGSQYGAKDFIVGEGREKFQTDLTDSLARTLADKKILVHNALIRHVNVPDQILQPIQEASIAVEQDLTNKEMQNTAKKQAELNTEQGMIEQSRERVAQETEKMRAEILAEQETLVAQLGADTVRQTALVDQKTAEIKATKTRTAGEAEAQTVKLVDGEKATGFELNAKAFKDPVAYAQWEFANKLNESIRVNVIHAGPGTLWTDLDKARLGDLGAAKVLQDQAKPAPKPKAP